MNYTIYKVTNKMNSKIYIGSHKTRNLNDGYMGSGKYVTRAIEKHGIDNFVKEILFVFDTPELMYAKEAELVDKEFLTEANTYNLKVGGFGGWDYVNATMTPEERSIISRLGGLTRHISADDMKDRISKGIQKSENRLNGNKKAKELYPNSAFYGKKHSKETRRKIGRLSKGRNIGDKNGMFGKARTEEDKEKIRNTLATKPAIICPHCNYINNSAGAMKRWHLDNCKQR